jgi:hypothetical protein
MIEVEYTYDQMGKVKLMYNKEIYFDKLAVKGNNLILYIYPEHSSDLRIREIFDLTSYTVIFKN